MKSSSKVFGVATIIGTFDPSQLILTGANIWLGPMVNIARVPFGGRNFESYGEDPFLSSVIFIVRIF